MQQLWFLRPLIDKQIYLVLSDLIKWMLWYVLNEYVYKVNDIVGLINILGHYVFFHRIAHFTAQQVTCQCISSFNHCIFSIGHWYFLIMTMWLVPAINILHPWGASRATHSINQSEGAASVKCRRCKYWHVIMYNTIPYRISLSDFFVNDDEILHYALKCRKYSSSYTEEM